jgi:NADH-quinone oxidoreductase subunit J
VIEVLVFAIAAAIVVAGALGVVLSSNPVHAALSLVGTLFGIAVLFVEQQADFLAAVQVIVYAGAIVVLFLFVIMLLGVDRSENLETDPLGGQRPAAIIAGGALLGSALVTLILTHRDLASVAVGSHSVVGKLSDPAEDNVTKLGRALFTNYLFAFEITSVLLVIAVVAAVVLARRAAMGAAERLGGDEAEDAAAGEGEDAAAGEGEALKEDRVGVPE